MTDSKTLPDLGIRFTLRQLPGLTFVRYPVDVPPPEGTVGFCNGPDWQCPAMFKDGAWRTIRGRPLNRAPTHWTAMERAADGE